MTLKLYSNQARPLLGLRGTTHRDELLGRGRMNGDGVIKLSLRGAHRDGDGETLQHLVRAGAEKVDTDNLNRQPIDQLSVFKDKNTTY